MKNQNIRIMLSIVAILPVMLSAGCVQVRNVPKSTTMMAAGPNFAQAEAFEANYDFQHAAESYLAITEKFPQSAIAFQRLAICLDKQGLTTQSKPYYLQALRLDPKNADLHCDYGYSSYVQSDLAQAEQSYQTALRLNANLARAHNNLAQVLAQTNRVTEAVQHFQMAGCNAEQIRHNLEFATTGNPASVPAVSSPEPQGMFVDMTPPTPSSQIAQSVLKQASSTQVQQMQIDDEIPLPRKVVVANSIPLPAQDVNFASFEKPAIAENRASTELFTQHSSRRIPESSGIAQPSPKTGFNLSDSQ